MKDSKYILKALVISALLASATSCHKVEMELPDTQWGSTALSVTPKINEGSLTRAVDNSSIATLHEDYLRSLDVFVVGKNVTYWKAYHLTWETPTIILNETSIKEKVDQLLAEDWYAEGLRVENKYKVYVSANSASLTGANSSISSVEDLKKLRVADATAEQYLWPDGTVDPSKLNLYKLYKAGSSTSSRIFTPTKEFIMSGMIDDWSPTGTGAQVFYVDLARAASKFVINVKFSEDFLKSLKYEHTKKADGSYEWKTDDSGELIILPDAKKSDIFGYPAWRFGNFSFEAPVFDPANFNSSLTACAGSKSNLILSSGALLHDPSAAEGSKSTAVYEGDDKHFTLTTYSYPHVWTEETVLDNAPAINLSIGFIDGTDNVSYKYYRIPLVSKDVTEIGRNKIYVVNATIASSGSTLLSEAEALVLDYEVLPWNEPAAGSDAPAPIKEVKNYFLSVTPQTYTLRGNGSQSVDLVYNLPVGERIKIQYFNSKEANEAILDGSSPAEDQGIDWGDANYAYQGLLDQSKKAAWYYNKDKTYRQSFGGNNVQYGITVNNNDKTNSKGTITVQSDALANKAIKYIAFRVYLDVDDWYNKGLYKDVIIRHFPTDNIQSIEGNWSSRWDGGSATTPITRTEETFDLSVAQSWGTYNTKEIEVSASDIHDRIEKNYTRRNNYYDYEITETTAQDFRNRVSEDRRDNANSFYNAREINRNGDYYYYWGEDLVESNSSDYDYYEYSWGRRYYYKYSKYYYARYYEAKYYRTKYYRTVTNYTYGTGSWVDWDIHANKTFTSLPIPYTYDGSNFQAKVWSKENNQVRGINVYNRNTDTIIYTEATSQDANNPGWIVFSESDNQIHWSDSHMTGLNNNHMYVIQITRTSDKYVLGRPELDSNYQTEDHVVSPAFMIASQLGAVRTFGSTQEGGRNAAIHCGTYMEVGQDGTRYTGWRLPTEEEIDVIVSYQGRNQNSVTIDGITITGDDRVMTPVLTGDYYWTSNKTTKATNYTQEDSNIDYAVRCIRDLSAKELEALNR